MYYRFPMFLKRGNVFYNTGVVCTDSLIVNISLGQWHVSLKLLLSRAFVC